MKLRYKILVAVIGALGLLSVAASNYTVFQGLEIQPATWMGTNALLVKNTSGTAVFTISSAGAVDIQGVMSLDNAETIDNTTDDMIEFQGVGGTDNTDLRLDLDGTYPIWSSPTDNDIGITENLIASGGMTLTCTGCITGTNVANVTRTMTTPLYAWRTSAGAAPLAIVAGTTPNTATEGNFETIEWATGEQASKIETTIIVPADYVSGMALKIWHAHDAAAANNAETFSADWYTAAAGGADNPAVAQEGAVALSAEAETVTTTSIPLDAAATIAAGQPLRVLFGFTSIDQTVHVFGLGFTYTSAQ